MEVIDWGRPPEVSDPMERRVRDVRPGFPPEEDGPRAIASASGVVTRFWLQPLTDWPSPFEVT